LIVGPYRFAPSVFITLVGAAFVALAVSLGNWQTGRAAQKQAMQDAWDRGREAAPVDLGRDASRSAESLAGQRVSARGEWDAMRTIFVDNRVRDGRPGYHVVTPLRIDGTKRWVLVNRGWAPAGHTRADLPSVPTPSGSVVVQGVAVVPPDKVFELGEVAPGEYVWPNLVLERFRTWSGFDLAPVVVQQTNETGDGLVRDWPRPDFGIEKHKAYALQWYALAALTVILYVVLNLKRERS
jgi:surfeit locus 1 family protein